MNPPRQIPHKRLSRCQPWETPASPQHFWVGRCRGQHPATPGPLPTALMVVDIGVTVSPRV